MRSNACNSIAKWDTICVVNFNESDELDLVASYAIMLPAVGSYRLVHIYWDYQVPFIAQSSVIAKVDDVAYPALGVVNVRALRRKTNDLLVLRPDCSLFLVSGFEYYGIAVAQDPSNQSAPLRLVWAGDGFWKGDEESQGILKVDALHQSVGSHVSLVANSKTYTVSFDLAPANMLTSDALDVLRYGLPREKWNVVRRRRLRLWISRGLPTSSTEELDCLWIALFEVLGASFIPVDPATLKQSFNKLTDTASHSRLADDAILLNFRLPQHQPRITSNSFPTLSPLAAPVLYALHVLAQSLRIDITRSHELSLLLKPVLRLSSQIAPAWTDYWSRICPDVEEAWMRIDGGKNLDNSA